MRRRRAALAVLSTVFFLLLAVGLSGPASAGGPTSVLLVVPGEGRTAGLYYTDPDYETLANLVGAFDSGTGSRTLPMGAADGGPAGTLDASGPGVTLTWMMHDVAVWRVDRVFLGADGGPLISTQGGPDETMVGAKPARWHRAADPARLTALLNRLDLGQVAVDPTPPGAKPGTQPVAAVRPAQQQPTNDDDGTSLDGWIWGPLGAVLGSALTLAALSARRRAAPEV